MYVYDTDYKSNKEIIFFKKKKNIMCLCHLIVFALYWLSDTSNIGLS